MATPAAHHVAGLLLGNLASGVCGAALAESIRRLSRRSGNSEQEKKSLEVQTQLSACDFLVPATPLRPNESARLQRLCELQALGLESSRLLDDITAVLGWIVEVPIVLVSLVTSRKLCFRARFGLDARHVPREEHSLCAWCISPTEPTVLIVEDASLDKRTCLSGIVQGPPFIKFYAGCPLQTSDGHPLGTLCLIDQVPRKLNLSVSQLLVNFAEIVTRNMERFDLEGCELPSVQVSELEDEVQPPPTRQSYQAGPLRLERVCRSYEEAHLLVLVDSESTSWPVLWADSRWHKLTNISVVPPTRDNPESVRQRVHFWDAVTWLDECGLAHQHGGVPRPDETFAQKIRDRATFRLSLLLRSMNSPTGVEASARCVPADMPLDTNAMAINSVEPTLIGEGREDFHISPREHLYFFIIRPCKLTKPGQKVKSMVRLAGRLPSLTLFEDVTCKRQIGTGSFGRVFLGDWIGAQVAVKVVQRLPATDQPGSLLEAALSAALSHPNIVQTFEHATREVFGEPDPIFLKFLGPGVKLASETRLYETVIVQEWCDRGTLTRYIEESPPLGAGDHSVGHLRDIARDVASALAYMHARSVVHGDLSSSNVLLASRPNERGFICKVCDFGLARAVLGEATEMSAVAAAKAEALPALLGPPKRAAEGDAGKSSTPAASASTPCGVPASPAPDAAAHSHPSKGSSCTAGIETMALGTVHYMPPEMLSFSVPRLTVKVDVYSFGVIVWQLVTGKMPWMGLSPPQVVIRVSRGKRLELPAATAAGSPVPDSLRSLVDRCTALSAEQRPEARTVVEMLDQLAASSG